MKELNVVKIMDAQGINPRELKNWVYEYTDRINQDALEQAEEAYTKAWEADTDLSWETREVEEAQEYLKEQWLPAGIRKITAEQFGMVATPLFHRIFDTVMDEPEPTEYWYNGVFHSHTDRSW